MQLILKPRGDSGQLQFYEENNYLGALVATGFFGAHDREFPLLINLCIRLHSSLLHSTLM